MSRRTAERHSRRVEVRFWRRGQEQPHSGFTIDLSKTGLFLGTSMSLEPGERLRLEVVDRERGFLIEGQVARIHRVAVALRHVQQPGVGVRFLGPGELVGNFLNAGKAGGTAPQRRSSPTAIQEPPATAPEPAPPPASSPPAPPAPAFRSALARPAPDSLEDLFGPDPAAESAATAPPAEPEPAAAPASAASVPAARTVPVEFANRDGFLAVYGRDIAAGGLFVTTETPASLHEVVLIELRPPIRADQRFCFEARVVHRFDAQTGGAKPGLTGMGVQFLDPDRVRAALAPIVAELGG
jgi:Tfp pilus assembly protein PilZ